VTIPFISGCLHTASPNTVTQVSTIDALLAGVYDGHLPCKQLLDYGDTGIGTFDKLDGEMALIDGIVYQVKTDGNIYTPSSSMSTPFACVANFKADKSFSIDRPMSLGQLEKEIDKRSPNKNSFAVVHVRGTFSQMKTRSVPAQETPYPPLKEVVKKQTVFQTTDISGRIVGFHCPPLCEGNQCSRIPPALHQR